MALSKLERHPINSTTPQFQGYWAYKFTGQSWEDEVATVELNLYYSVADYDADKKGNVLRAYPTTFYLQGQVFRDIFLNPDATQAQIGYQIFTYIKNFVEDEGEPPYFADAEIVP